MEKTYVNELNFEDFCKVYDRCKKLQEMAYNYASDDAYYTVDDILYYAPKDARYEIGGYGYSFIDFSRCEKDEVIKYLKDVNNEYCVFDDNFETNIAKFERYSTVVIDAYYGDIEPKEKDLEFCENAAEKLLKEFQDVLTKYLVSYYDFDDDFLKDAAYSCEWFNGFYVDDNGDIYEERHDIKIA